ncbi:MAG: AMP-binding protein, partial [Myxococcota bacterium]|nr:AMP-binding protein [Myxococcota bacterium]
ARNRIEFPLASFAVSRLGAVVVPVNVRLAPDELRFVLEDCEARHVFVEAPFAEALQGIRGRLPKQGGVVGLGMSTWPVALTASLPLGLALLAIVGLVAALRRPLRWTAAPAALLVLHGVYWTSAHNGDAPYEVLRYAALESGLAMVLAALGWGVVVQWSQGRRFGDAAWIVLGGLCLVSLPDGVWRPMLETHHRESEGPLYDMPLSRHLQAEARALVDVLEGRPECLVVTVSAVEPSASREVTAYEYVFFGGSLAAPQIADRVPGAFGPLVDTVAAKGECVLFHRGLDCHVAGGPDCREEVAGATFVKGLERAPRPYYDHVLRTEPVRLELWQR